MMMMMVMMIVRRAPAQASHHVKQQLIFSFLYLQKRNIYHAVSSDNGRSVQHDIHSTSDARQSVYAHPVPYRNIPWKSQKKNP